MHSQLILSSVLLETVPSACCASLGFSDDSSLRCKHQFKLCPLEPPCGKCLVRLPCFIHGLEPPLQRVSSDYHALFCLALLTTAPTATHIWLVSAPPSSTTQCSPCQGGLCWGSEWHLPSILGKLNSNSSYFLL